MYRTQYLVVKVSESRNVTDCCAGFEQLGLYCVLRESRVRGWDMDALPAPQREELLGLCVQA